MAVGEEEAAFDEQYELTLFVLEIADRMHALGLSQRQLAERLGVTEGRMSQILGAECNLTFRSLARLARAVGCRATLAIVETPGLPFKPASR